MDKSFPLNSSFSAAAAPHRRIGSLLAKAFGVEHWMFIGAWMLELEYDVRGRRWMDCIVRLGSGRASRESASQCFRSPCPQPPSRVLSLPAVVGESFRSFTRPQPREASAFYAVSFFFNNAPPPLFLLSKFYFLLFFPASAFLLPTF